MSLSLGSLREHTRCGVLRLHNVVLVLAVVCNAKHALATTQTTVTTYAYNADGAPSAVTTQVDGQIATTVYLTWDDFVPGTADPTTGSVRAGNGNLLGAGPA